MIAAPVHDSPPAIVLVDAAPVVQATSASQVDGQKTDPQPSPGAAPDPSQPGSAQPPAATVPAAQPQSQRPQEVHLLGDWFGIRRDLVDAGVTPTLAYIGQALTARRGASTRRLYAAGQFTAGVGLDLKKITGVVPGDVQVTITRRYGKPFNADAGLDLLVNPLSIQGRGEVWRLSQLSYRTDIGKLNVKLGRLLLNDDFNQGRCDFISGYFCLGENIRVFPTIWPTNPVSQWAVRLQYPVAAGVRIKAGVYQYNPKNLDTERNFYVGWKGATGVTVPAEVVYTPKLGGKLPGTYTAGFYFSNADMNDPVLNAAGEIRAIAGGEPLQHDAEWGGYVTARQQVVAPRKDGSHGLAVFFNLSVASQQSTPNASAASLGLNYTGVLPFRPKDEIGLAIGRGRLNDRITDAARYINANGLGNVPVRTSEYAIEAYYGITIAPGLVLQPDIQFVFDPAGDKGRRNVVLAGFKTTVTL